MNDAEHLFGAYFYEDWDDYEYASWEEAVDDFSRRSPERVPGAAREIASLLSRDISDDELGVRVRQLGCAYLPADGDRAWLGRVLQRLTTGTSDS